MIKRAGLIALSFICIASLVAHERKLYSTIYIFNPSFTHVIMHMHKKHKHWMPPGGTIEAGESPQDTVMREVYEEAGLVPNLISAHATCNGTIVPFSVEHYHQGHREASPGAYSYAEAFDFIFLATIPDDGLEKRVNKGDESTIRWIAVTEILAPSFDAYPWVKNWVTFFSQTIAPQILQQAYITSALNDFATR